MSRRQSDTGKGEHGLPMAHAWPDTANEAEVVDFFETHDLGTLLEQQEPLPLERSRKPRDRFTVKLDARGFAALKRAAKRRGTLSDARPGMAA